MHPYPLKQIIKDRIAREGPISFAAFMEMALYYPELGYYMSDPVPFGPAGDYYTSPHLHPVFGRLLAIQLDEMRQLLGCPDDFTVMEVGAGQGSLAAGIIDQILAHLKWEMRWKYVIVERNPLAREEQRKTLQTCTGQVQWKTSLDEVDPFRGCIVTNELLDAFPVHRICMADRFREVYVDCQKNRFTQVYDDCSSDGLTAYIATYRIPAVSGYRTEVNLRIHDYLKSISRVLSEGFTLTIDYGYSARQYYAVERNRGTLLCYYRHTTDENPYRRVGRQDITAHVNFTSLKDWGQEFGLACLGYCPQGSFLVSLGAEELVNGPSALERLSVPELLKIKSLLLDLGSTHQVMIQYKGNRSTINLKGFAVSNRIGWL